MTKALPCRDDGGNRNCGDCIRRCHPQLFILCRRVAPSNRNPGTLLQYQELSNECNSLSQYHKPHPSSEYVVVRAVLSNRLSGNNGRCAAPSASDDISDTIDLLHSYPGVSFKQDYSSERIIFYPDGTIDADDNQQTPFNRIYSLKDSKGSELELKFTGAGAVRIKRPQDP